MTFFSIQQRSFLHMVCKPLNQWTHLHIDTFHNGLFVTGTNDPSAISSLLHLLKSKLEDLLSTTNCWLHVIKKKGLACWKKKKGKRFSSSLSEKPNYLCLWHPYFNACFVQSRQFSQSDPDGLTRDYFSLLLLWKGTISPTVSFPLEADRTGHGKHTLRSTASHALVGKGGAMGRRRAPEWACPNSAYPSPNHTCAKTRAR